MSTAEPIRLRAYAPQDLKILHALDQDCFPPGIAFSRTELRSYINHRNSVVRVAELGEQIVGFAVGIQIDSESAHVVTLDVALPGRRRKIGTALMNALHEEFQHTGAEVCFLEVDVQNTAARRFYERLQYKYLEFLPGYYGNRRDGFRMARSLAGPARA